MRPVEVRPAVPAEAPALSRLLAEVIRDSYTEHFGSTAVGRLVAQHCALPRISAEIGIPGGAPGWLGWLVATAEDGAVVGAAAGGVPTPGEGEVYCLCTAPARRREGIGSGLLDAVTLRMTKHGAGRQSVSLPRGDDPAVPFYRALGFGPAAPAGTRWMRTV